MICRDDLVSLHTAAPCVNLLALVWTPPRCPLVCPVSILAGWICHWEQPCSVQAVFCYASTVSFCDFMTNSWCLLFSCYFSWISQFSKTLLHKWLSSQFERNYSILTEIFKKSVLQSSKVKTKQSNKIFQIIDNWWLLLLRGVRSWYCFFFSSHGFDGDFFFDRFSSSNYRKKKKIHLLPSTADPISLCSIPLQA